MWFPYRIMTVCSTGAENINSQKLSWTAALRAENEGKRVGDYGLGYVPHSRNATHGAATPSHLNLAPPVLSEHERRLLAASPSTAHHAIATTTRPKTTRAPTSSTPPRKRPTTSHKLATTTRAAATPPPDSYAVPPAYDARDIYEGQVACKAYTVLDQGSCDSCYAFASAAAFSARLCRSHPTSLGNAALSPQQMMDCTSGCNGGNPVGAFQALLDSGDVELWCDPYTQAQQACGSFCPTGNRYTGVQGSLLVVGGAGPAGLLQMQYELVRAGPGVVSFTVMDDFFSYAGGVYTPSAGAAAVGGHMVSLVGWGEDQGVPYWLCQNSWGAGFGEAGFFRIARGSDTCGIESSGLTVLRPAAPAACPRAKCANGAVTLADCTCRCDNGRTGPDCAVCALRCINGGVLDAGCTHCTCPRGFGGPNCEAGYAAAPLAVSADAAAPIAVSYSFSDGAPPPTQGTMVAVYPLGEQDAYMYLTAGYLCGQAYDAAVDGGLCPPAGTATIPNPGVPGDYQIAVAPWTPGSDW